MKNFAKKSNKKTTITLKDLKKTKKTKLPHSKKKKNKPSTSSKRDSPNTSQDFSIDSEDVAESIDLNVSNDEEFEDGSDNVVEKHKQSLKNLEKIDPEFHKFLQENDKDLLDFDSSASEDDDDKDAENEQYHEPPESLEVASDASDYEDDSAVEVSGKITINMIDAWEKELESNRRDLKPVRVIVRAFHACLVRISGDSSDNVGGLRVDGSAVFNAIVRLCVTSLYSHLSKYMNLPNKSVTKKHVEKSKKWPYAKTMLRSYLIDLIKLLNNVTSEDIQRVLLKHLHQMIPFVACLPTISKPFLKQVISLWSSNNDDTVRVVSFLCLLRYGASDINMYLHSVLKKMYISFVANSKFVSVNSLPAINFLRKSLAEMFSLNETIAYNHAFLYIRQLAVYLRAAVTLKKKDSIQTVYNWQFISSLWLWVDVLCSMREKQQMNSLIYPIIQIIIGCIKLVPTAQYFPLRFHCVQMLIKLSKEVDVFIPVLPFLVEALSILHTSMKHKKLSMKPMDFTYILRLSKSQLQENAFKDAVVENVYDCLLQYTANESYRISFPDTIVLLLIQVKQFLKECKNANYSKKLKPLLEKIEDVSKMMSEERSKCGIALSDATAIAAWESKMKLKSNTLITFYESWCKIQEQKATRKIVDQIQLSEYELPVLKKLPGKEKKKEVSKKKNDRFVLFDSDTDDGGDDEIDFKIDEDGDEEKKKKTKKSKQTKRKIEETDEETELSSPKKKSLKKKKKKVGDDSNREENKKSRKHKPSSDEEPSDIVQDFKLDDFMSQR